MVSTKYIFVGIAKVKNIIFQSITPYFSITCIYLHIERKFPATLVRDLFKIY